MTMNTSPLNATVQLVKALAHPTRLRILALLRQGPLPVCQITSVLHSVASTVSGHLNDLRHSGLVTDHHQGKFVYYSLSDTPSTAAVLNAIFGTVVDDAQLRQDAALGESIRAMSPVIVCDGSPLWPHERVATERTGGPRGPRS
jgi:DNA-binding transcriptional ArsR family regulator